MKVWCFISLFLFATFLKAQNFASWKNNLLILDNGVVVREIVVENGHIHTKNLKIKGSDLNFDSEQSKEFSLEIDGRQCDGESGWNLITFVQAGDSRKGNGVTIKLQGINEFTGIEADITYLLYPDLPVIRKKINLLNNSGKEIRIESFDVEKLIMGFH